MRIGEPKGSPFRFSIMISPCQGMTGPTDVLFLGVGCCLRFWRWVTWWPRVVPGMTFGQFDKHSLTALPSASLDPAMLTFFWAELSRFSTLGDLCCELDVDGHAQQTDE